MAALGLLAVQPVLAANKNIYFDINDTSAGFGDPSGSYGIGDSPGWWDDSSAGTGTFNTYSGWAGSYSTYVYFGNSASDFNGDSFTIDDGNLGGSYKLYGLTVNSTNVTVTLVGNANWYCNNSTTTFSVAQGSTLVIACTGNTNASTGASGGLNFNKKAIHLNGSGTITFETQIGRNSSTTGPFTQNGPTVNISASSLEGGVSNPYQAGYTLQSGALNFGTANSSDAFVDFVSPASFTISGGTIDNTSGSAMTLTNGGDGVVIGGDFTFTGTSDLDFGTAPVALTTTPTITVSAGTLTIDGVVSGSGNGLTKAGAGTLALTAANTYDGGTTVSGGTLALSGSGSIANSASITLNGGVLSAGDLTLSSAVITDTPSQTGDILVSGTLTYSSIDTLTIPTLPGYSSYPQQFPLITFGTFGGTFSAPTTLNLPSGYTGHLVQNTSSIDLVLDSGPPPVVPITWTGEMGGANNGDWDILTTSNWVKTADGTTPYFYQNGSDVTFDDSAVGATNVNLTTTLAPNSITVNNTASTATANYSFTGSGAISGGSLTKQGSGDLAIANDVANDFSGGITLDAGTLTFDQSSDITLANAVGGSGGTFVKNGANTLTLSGDNSSFTGDVLIEDGTLVASDNNSIGDLSSGTVTITSGGTFDIGGNPTQDNANFGAKPFYISGAGVGGEGAIVNNGPVRSLNAFQDIILTADATIGGGNRWDIRNGTPTLDLAGHTLTKVGTNQLSMVAVNVTDGNINIDGGVISFETDSAVHGSGTITVNPGGALGGYRTSGGAITRAVDLNGGSLMDLNGKPGMTNDSPISLTADSFLDCSSGATSITYLNGIISGTFGLTKTNSNTYNLTAANTYQGDTIIVGGGIALVDGGSIADSASIQIDAGATFDVSGVTSSPYSIVSGQTLQGLTGTGTVNGALTLDSGASLAVNYDGSTPTLTVTGGALTLNDNDVTVTVTGAALDGGTYKLISAGSGGSVAGSVASSSLIVNGSGVVAGATTSLQISGGELYLVVNSPPVIANIVTNSVNSGLTWKISILSLSNSAAWSDADGETLTLSSVDSLSANSVSVSSDANYIYYNGPVTAEDHFGYTISDGTLTANGTVYLEAVDVASATHISNPSVDGSGHPTFSGHGIPGYTYGVEWASSLSGPWANAGQVTTDSEGAWSFTDTAQTNPGTIFYRLYYPYDAANPPQ